MSWTSRRSLLALLTVSAGLPLLAATPGLAAPRGARREDDEDDDARGIPNLFISPCGEPFRADEGAPYPVVDWFKGADKNGDGKLDHGEFVADAARFFKRLDLGGVGYLSRYDILVYEKQMVPEILGGTVNVGMKGAPRLVLAQYGPSAGQGLSGVNASINPQGDKAPPPPPKPKGLDESGAGASPYSFFEEPEPIMTADFNVNGTILRDNFLKVADMHFTSLDQAQRGYLTLNSLPKTAVERMLDRSHKDRRRS